MVSEIWIKRITYNKSKILEMTEIDEDSDPRRRTRKRTFNTSWDSDDELLQDDLLIKKSKGDQSDDELDEAALLGLSDSEDNAWNEELPLEENGTDHINNAVYNEEEEFNTNIGEFDQTYEEEENDSLNSSKDHIVPRQSADNTFDSTITDSGTVDVLDIDITTEIDDDFDKDLDATTESNFEDEAEEETAETHEETVEEETTQEPEDYSKTDIKDEGQVEEKIDNAKSESSESEEEEEEDEKEESGRGRFKSERQPSVVLHTSVRSKRDIPETLEISKEAKEKLDEFNRKKDEERQSKRNRRGGRGGYGNKCGSFQQNRGNKRGGLSQHGPSQHGGLPQSRDNYERGAHHTSNQSRMRFPARPLLNHAERNQNQGVHHVPMGMNITMFGQQDQTRLKTHHQRPPLMQCPPTRHPVAPQQPPSHQRPPICSQPLPSSSVSGVQKSEPQPKIHINPHFKGSVQVSSQGPTWNNQPVSGQVTSTTNAPRLPNPNRPPDNYNTQQVPHSSWNQPPRLTPAQTWTTPQTGHHPYRDSQPPATPSHNFDRPSHRVPESMPRMPHNAFQPRMQPPHQIRPTIPNQQHQPRPRADFVPHHHQQQPRPRADFPPRHQQPNYPPQQHLPRYSPPPVQQQQNPPHLLNQPGMNQGPARHRFPGPGATQGTPQHSRQPVPQFRQQAPRFNNPMNNSQNYSPSPTSSPRLNSPQPTNKTPSQKPSPKLAAPPQKLIEEANSKMTVQVEKVTNEDAETRRLRIQIEEQKKLREEIMKRKEERRQQLAAKRKEELKKRLAAQGHDVAEETKKLGLDPVPNKPAPKKNNAPDAGGDVKRQENFLKQKLSQQQQHYQTQQAKPIQDGSVKVWKQQQNLKVLVDEPRPIPTLGVQQPSQPMQAPQQQNNMRGQTNRGKGHGREGHQQHLINPNTAPHPNQPPYTHQMQPQQTGLQQVPVQHFENQVTQPHGASPQKRQLGPQGGGQMRGKGAPMRGRGKNFGRGQGQAAQGGSMQQKFVGGGAPQGRGTTPQGRGMTPRGRGMAPQGRGMAHQGRGMAPQGRGTTPHGRGISPQGRGMSPQGRGIAPQGRGMTPHGRAIAPHGRGSSPLHPTPGNTQAPPAPGRKSVKERLGHPSGVPQQQGFHQVPTANQVPNTNPQRVVVPPGQNVQQFQHRQVVPNQPNPMEGARLVKTEPILNRVIIEGLSASTIPQSIMQLTKNVGPVQNFHFVPTQRKAFVTFNNPQHACMFQKKYNRHMLDLSMMNVTLLPAT